MALQVVGGTYMVGKSLSLELESLLSYLVKSQPHWIGGKIHGWQQEKPDS